MKKFVLFATACLLSLSINAQSFVIGNAKAQKSPVASDYQWHKNSQRTLAANQYLCGMYTTDEIAQYGYGFGSYGPADFTVATIFDNSILAPYSGFKVVGMRVGVSENIKNFALYLGKLAGTNVSNILSKSVGTGSKGWNTVMLDESEQFALNANDELMVGYTYYQGNDPDPDYPGYYTDECYPVSVYDKSEKSGNLYIYGNLGDGTGWYDIGNAGALSVQLIVEGELSDQKVIIEGLATDNFGKIGAAIPGVITIINMGKTDISSLAFNYYIDDTKVGDATSTTTIASTKSANINLSIPVPADLSAGQHTVKIELSAINGAAPTGEITNNNITASFVAYTESVARQKQLIEHITSWTCTYCYLGYSLLRQMEEQYSDVAWVAIHGNQSTQKDPYYFTECDYIMSFLGANSFPSASFNRTYMSELAEGGADITYSIGYNEQYTSQVVPYIHNMMVAYNVPSFVSLDIKSSFNATSREMTATVSGTGVSQAAQMLDGYGVTIYLTEAELKGKQYSSGKWNNNFDHNNTLRAVLTNVNGDDITWSGDNFTMTKSFTVPADYKEDNLSIVAFVAPKPSANIYNMSVNNCEKVKLDLTSTGISSVSTTNATESVRYTLDGRQISAPQHGLNIVKMSDGSVRKVMVK